MQQFCPHPLTMLIIVGALSAVGYNVYNREDEVLSIRDTGCDYGYATPTGDRKHCIDVDECALEGPVCPRFQVQTDSNWFEPVRSSSNRSDRTQKAVNEPYCKW